MHKINPRDLPEMKIVDLTVARAAVIFASITLFFVLPVLGITYFQANPIKVQETVSTSQNIEPKVAGVNESTMATDFAGINMNSEQGLLLIIGIILVGISIIIALFFLLDGGVKKKG